MKTRITVIYSAFAAVVFGMGSLALFATANSRALTREDLRDVDAQAHGPNLVPLAPSAWVARYNGPANRFDRAAAIAVDNSGNVYVTGRSSDPDFSRHYATVKYNSTGQQQWVARYNGPGNHDEAKAIAVDGSGNVYVTGESFGMRWDYATIKYNSSGQEQWVARYNGPTSYDDRAKAIAVDSAGNVYVTGESRNLNGYSDYVTIKYSSTGQELWVARYYSRPGNYEDAPSAIAIDASGNAYVTGTSLFYTIAAYDYGTIKYNSAGQQQWVARYNGNSYDYAAAIAVDNSGNVYVTGTSHIAGGGDSDYATIKYNAAGQQQWVARYDGPASSYDDARAIAVDSSGNVYVTGQDIGTTHPDYDYATIKYNLAGQEQWIARYNGPGNGWDAAIGVAVDSSGNVYVTGDSPGSATDHDYATIRYDSSGQEQSVARYNGPANSYDSATAIAVDSSGNIYVTGGSYGQGTDSDYATIKYATASVQVTVQTNPVGRTFTVDGTTYNSTQTFSWPSGSTHTIATTSPQSGGTGIRYVWTRWSDNGAISHTVAPTTNTTYTANFRTQYRLTMSHGTGGTVRPASGWRNSGSAVSISAIPASGYSFSNWTGSGTGSYSGTNNPASITMGGPITETATFTHN